MLRGTAVPQDAAAPLSRRSLKHQLGDASAVLAGQVEDAAAAAASAPQGDDCKEGSLLSDTGSAVFLRAGSAAFLRLHIREVMPDNNQVCRAAHTLLTDMMLMSNYQ